MVYGEQFMKAINYPESDSRICGLKYIDCNLKTLLYCCDVKDFHVFENENNRWHPESGSGGRLFVFSRNVAPRVCAYLVSGRSSEFGILLLRLAITQDLEYLALQDHSYFTYGNRERYELRLKLPHEVHVLGRVIQLVHKYEAYKIHSSIGEQDIEAILRFGRAAMRFCFMHNPLSFVRIDEEKGDSMKGLKNFSDSHKSLIEESVMTRTMLKRKPDWQNEFYHKNFYIVKNAWKKPEELGIFRKQKPLFGLLTNQNPCLGYKIPIKDSFFVDMKIGNDRSKGDFKSSMPLFAKTPQKRLFSDGKEKGEIMKSTNNCELKSKI